MLHAIEHRKATAFVTKLVGEEALKWQKRIALLGVLLMLGTAAFAQESGINVQTPPYNAACNGTTDDSAALNSAVQAAITTGVSAVYIPPGCRLGLNSTQIVLANVKLFGKAPMDVGAAASGLGTNFGQTGSQIWLYNPTAAPFILESGSEIENLDFYWPNETETVAAATYPVTVTGGTSSTQTDTLVVQASSASFSTQTVTVSIPAQHARCRRRCSRCSGREQQ